MNYEDTEPYMSAFLLNLHVNGLCGIVFNRFYRLEIHSLMVGIFDPACELLPPWTKELYSTCELLPLYLLSALPPLSHTKCTVYTDNVWWGWGILNCVVYHILQEFYTLFLTRFRT